MKLYSWGANTNGQLGHNYISEQISRPAKIPDEFINSELKELTTWSSNSVHIHGGGTQILMSIKNPGSASSTLIYLGVPNTVLKNTSLSPELFTPKVISKDLKIKSISSGWEFNLILTEENEVYTFGENKYGQLGRSGEPFEIHKIPNFKAVKIVAGLRHAAAISTEGELYIWGDNSKFQLENHGKIIKVPTKVSDHKFWDVKSGKSFILALDGENTFWGLGSTKFGELGSGCSFLKKIIRLTFRLPIPTKVLQIECGWTHTLVLLDDFRVISWGRNNFSQLGRTTLKDFDENWGVVESIHEPIASICCGSEHNFALSLSGKNLYTWGWNEHENCGVESSRVSFCEGSDGAKVKLCEDCVLTPTIVGISEDRILYVACGNGNGFALCQ